MKHHCRASGAGPDLVLIHGWGLNGDVWTEPCREPALAHAYRLHRVDLPGHGRSAPLGEHSLERVTASVGAVVPERAVWLGWSLGGLLALDAAQRWPQRVTALVVVASNPCFVRTATWPHGIRSRLLAEFASALEDDPGAALGRFLMLQARGTAGVDRRVARRLRAHLAAGGRPGHDALRDGLSILRDADLRAAASTLACPALAVLGEGDALVPARLARALEGLSPSWRAEVMPAAGHAPFLADPPGFARIVAEFLEHVL